jgi:uncharacterized membrane protein YfcA
MGFAVPSDVAVFLIGTFAAAFVTGLAGFAFGVVAAGLWLHALTPAQSAALVVAYALLVQGHAVWKLRGAINPDGSCPSSSAARSAFPPASPCWTGCRRPV